MKSKPFITKKKIDYITGKINDLACSGVVMSFRFEIFAAITLGYPSSNIYELSSIPNLLMKKDNRRIIKMIEIDEDTEIIIEKSNRVYRLLVFFDKIKHRYWRVKYILFFWRRLHWDWED